MSDWYSSSCFIFPFLPLPTPMVWSDAPLSVILYLGAFPPYGSGFSCHLVFLPLTHPSLLYVGLECALLRFLRFCPLSSPLLAFGFLFFPNWVFSHFLLQVSVSPVPAPVLSPSYILFRTFLLRDCFFYP